MSEQEESGAVVLLIEDEVQIRRFLRASLTNNGYKLIEAATAQEGLAQFGKHLPDLVILDLGLPDRDGLDVTAQLREWTSTPIIVLSAREQEHDKIAALDAGADDYLTKPFGVGELLARMRVALRHAVHVSQELGEPIFTIGSLRVDLEHRQVFVDDEEVHLSPIEYKLLTTLIRYSGKVVTPRQLLKEVWGPEYTNENHYLRVYMGHLRHKLEADPTRPRYLVNEPGVGYRLKVE